MNILDENVLEPQRLLLLRWGIPFRQIGFEVGRKGMKDAEIIPFLLGHNHPTFFTRDLDFCKRDLCHARYGLVILAVIEEDTALFMRRLLRYLEFNTQAKRMGTVIRVKHEGLSVWRLHATQETHYSWIGTDGRALLSALREDKAPYGTGLPADEAAETESPETSF